MNKIDKFFLIMEENNMTGEEVANLFLNFHGEQLIGPEFFTHIRDEGFYIPNSLLPIVFKVTWDYDSGNHIQTFVDWFNSKEEAEEHIFDLETDMFVSNITLKEERKCLD